MIVCKYVRRNQPVFNAISSKMFTITLILKKKWLTPKWVKMAKMSSKFMNDFSVDVWTKAYGLELNQGQQKKYFPCIFFMTLIFVLYCIVFLNQPYFKKRCILSLKLSSWIGLLAFTVTVEVFSLWLEKLRALCCRARCVKALNSTLQLWSKLD